MFCFSAVFAKNMEGTLCIVCVLRDFQELGEMVSGGGECFVLFSWVLGICI